MNKVTVFFFAGIRDAIGKKKLEMELPDGATVADLRVQIKKNAPEVERVLDASLVSVNKEFAEEDMVIPQDAEIAFFPMVSGGSDNLPTVVAITEEEIDIDRVLREISTPTTGASCMFVGTVRGKTKRGTEHETSYLLYEAYEPMAVNKLEKIADEIRQRWDTIEGVAIIQRIGKLYPMTTTVLVACTAPHRDTGVFDAAQYGIDRLKEIVPVWKKEIGPDGEEWVEGHYQPKAGED